MAKTNYSLLVKPSKTHGLGLFSASNLILPGWIIGETEVRPAEKIDRFSFIQNLPTRHATTVCNFRYINHAPKSESNVRLRYKDGRRLVVATKIINFDDELLIPYWCDESQFDEKRLRKELLDDLKFLGLR